MGEPPSRPVVEAIEDGVAWLRGAAIRGIRVEKRSDDRVVVVDRSAPPLWARFYDLETEKPFFCGRDGVKKAVLAEVEKERRTGYAFYGNWPEKLIDEDYPRWKEKRRHTNPTKDC
jgi:PelA/Pel-15E family pectate lyase